jgi:hypothetical protein
MIRSLLPVTVYNIPHQPYHSTLHNSYPITQRLNDFAMSRETKEEEELDRLAELINSNLPQPPTLQGPYGPTPLVYADWTASGRSLHCIERIIQNKVGTSDVQPGRSY